MTDTDTVGNATDRMLLRRMAAGDRDALATMYTAYHGRLCRFLSRLTRRPDIIEEAINDCFWIAWQKPATSAAIRRCRPGSWASPTAAA